MHQLSRAESAEFGIKLESVGRSQRCGQRTDNEVTNKLSAGDPVTVAV